MSGDHRRALCIGVLLGVVLFGGYIRINGVSAQIAYDDELHSVAWAVTHPYSYIATHFSGADACIPLTLALKAAAQTIGISELSLRMVVLLAGLLSLVVLPALAWRSFGAHAALVFTGALAISPYLMHYSRYARPYGVSTLLVAVAIFAFHHWCCSRRRTSAVTYVLSAALATYFHLLAVFAALSPFVYAGIRLIRPGDRATWRVGARDCVALGLATAVALAVLHLPPLLSSAEAVLGKAGTDAPNRWTLLTTLHIFSGTSDGSLMLVFWGIVALGVAAGAVRNRSMTLLLLVAILAQAIGVAATRPSLVQIGIVYARYCVFVLPLILILFSLPFAALARGGGTFRRLAALGSAGAVLLALGWSGPIPSDYMRRNNFTNHPWVLPAGIRIPPFQPGRAALFYRELAADPEDYGIIEAPWFPHWEGNPFYQLQSYHRKRVFIGFAEPVGQVWTVYNFPVRRKELRFHHYVDLHDPARVQATGARFLILHKDLAAELGPASRGGAAPDVSRAESLYRERFKRTAYEDERIVVFDLGGGEAGVGG